MIVLLSLLFSLSLPLTFTIHTLPITLLSLPNAPPWSRQLLPSSIFGEQISSGKKIAVHFWATWSGPSLTLSHVFENLEGEHTGITFKVNVDEVSEVVKNVEIRVVPFFRTYHNGEEVDGVPGENMAILNEIIDGWEDRKMLPSFCVDGKGLDRVRLHCISRAADRLATVAVACSRLLCPRLTMLTIIAAQGCCSFSG